MAWLCLVARIAPQEKWIVIFPHGLALVMLSGARIPRSGIPAESKHPYTLLTTQETHQGIPRA